MAIVLSKWKGATAPPEYSSVIGKDASEMTRMRMVALSTRVFSQRVYEANTTFVHLNGTAGDRQAPSRIPSFFGSGSDGRNSQTNHADVESHPINGLMKPHIDRVEFVHGFLSRIFAGNLHARSTSAY